MNSLAISIIVWNNADDVIECAESLLAQTIADKMTILFVDNDSNEPTIKKVTAYINSKNNKNLVIIYTGFNGGTAGGFTAAAQWAEANGIEYIGALNADAIADSKWAESLLAEIHNHPEVGIVTGTVLHRDGETIDSTGDTYTTWGIPGPRGRDKPRTEAPKEAGYIFGATGGAYLARTAMYKNVGYYDQMMFMYYEDIDFSFRAQLAGFKVWFTPSAIVYHKRGASSDTVPGLAIYNTFKNLPLLFIKNVPRELLIPIGLRFGVAYTLILGNAVVHGNGSPALKGWLQSIKLLGYGLRERKKIQAAKTVSTRYINDIILHDIPPEQTGLRKFRKVFIGK